jgi:hypothetical protein
LSIILFTNFISDPNLFLIENLTSLYHIWVTGDYIKIKLDTNSSVIIKTENLIKEFSLSKKEVQNAWYNNNITFLIKERAQELSELIDNPNNTKIVINGSNRSLTKERFNSLDKTSITKLNLGSSDVESFNFSGFDNLEELYIDGAKNLTAEQFNSINKSKIKKLYIKEINTTDFIFSNYRQITELSLSNLPKLTADQFNSINKSNLHLLKLNSLFVDNFDISGFDNLKTLNLSHVTMDHFNGINKRWITNLKLIGFSCPSFDFSDLINLEELKITSIYGTMYGKFHGIEESMHYPGFTKEQLNSIPNKEKLTIIHLHRTNLEDFNFSPFVNVVDWSFKLSLKLTTKLFNEIPNKNNIANLDLCYIDVSGFVFSELENITSLNLKNTEDLTLEELLSLFNEEELTFSDYELIYSKFEETRPTNIQITNKNKKEFHIYI